MNLLTQTHCSTAWSLACLRFARCLWVFTAFVLPLSVSLTTVGYVGALLFTLLSGELFQFVKQAIRQSLVWAIGLLVFLVVCSMFYGDATLAAKLSFLRHFAKLLFIPLLLPLFNDDSWRERAIKAFILGVSLIALLTFVLTVMHAKTLYISSMDSGFLNHIAMSFMTAFAIYLCAFRCSLTTWQGRTYLLLTLFLGAQLFFINTGRVGYLAFVVFALIFIFTQFSLRQSLIALLIFIFIVLGIYELSPAFKRRVDGTVLSMMMHHNNSSTALSTELRLQYWHRSLQFIKQKPWLGYGAGSFQSMYFEKYNIPKSFSKQLGTPHSDYFNIAVQMGLLGLGALLLFYIVLLVSARRLNQYCVIAFGLVLAFMLCANTASILYLTVLGHFFVYFICVFYSRLTDKRPLNSDNNSH